MKHDCPYCGKSMAHHLVRSHPAPGERKFLPHRAIAVCPLCHRDIEANFHPLEKSMVSFMAIPAIASLFLVSYPSVALAIVTTVLVLILAGGIGYFHVKTRNWQRYRRYEAAP